MADDSNNNIGWFIAGLGLGALVGVLYAPKSGRETRDAIASTAREGREFAASKTREAREHVSQWTEKGRDTVGRHKDQITSAIEAGKQAYREVTSEKS